MFEIELKIEANVKQVRKKLAEIGAIKKFNDFNNDTYYNHPQRDFTQTDEALRIRRTSRGTYLTYKGPKFDPNSKSREEYEIEFKSDLFETILFKLGFVKSGQVKKRREIWQIDSFNISLDEVEYLGEYVELELVRKEKEDLEQYVSKLHELARQLGLNPDNHIRKSYLELLEYND